MATAKIENISQILVKGLNRDQCNRLWRFLRERKEDLVNYFEYPGDKPYLDSNLNMKIVGTDSALEEVMEYIREQILLDDDEES